MRHIFVVNPCAGGKDNSSVIEAAVRQMGKDCEVYRTMAPRDATRFVADCCRRYAGEALRFYACGGDGTLNEVVSGAVGFDGVEVGCYPCGSGNDYVKYWPQADFTHLEAQLKGGSVAVDVMRVGDRYCVNTLNFGFEAAVCHTMADVRRVPLLGGRMAYTTGILKSLATSMKNPCRISVDGAMWYEGDLLLASAANGMYAGGGYRCAPRAVNDDGLMEVLAVKPMHVTRFAKLIDYYKRGEHLDREELREVMQYTRAARLTIESDRPFFIATDGELLEGAKFEVECIHKAINFIIP